MVVLERVYTSYSCGIETVMTSFDVYHTDLQLAFVLVIYCLQRSFFPTQQDYSADTSDTAQVWPAYGSEIDGYWRSHRSGSDCIT